MALQIQLAHGELEYHFGVFVTLALLLVYLDWRPIVFAAGLFAVHHVLFDRLQAMPAWASTAPLKPISGARSCCTRLMW